MNYGSLCSGIEAASEAWIPLGWRAAFFAEIEAFPSAVLKQRHPGVPNLGDMTKFQEWPDAAINVLVGGTPCQSFSVAGLRGGLDDARGNLMLTYGAVARRYRPSWLVWENVPGVLSSNGGCDFASLLGLLTGRAVIAPAEGWQNSGTVPGIESAYGLAWRVLDAQYFGVPQRRRRVFVVGHIGDWRRAAAVLFERASLRGDPAPRRKAGQRPAPTISARPSGGGGLGTDFDCDGGLVTAPLTTHKSGGGFNGDFNCDGGLVPMPHADISPALKARDGKGPSSDGDGDGDGAILVPMVAQAFKASHFTRGKDGAPSDVVPPLSADADKGDQDAIQERAVCENPDAGPDGAGFRDAGQAYTLEARTVPQAVAFDVMTLAIRGRGDSHDLEYREDGTANAILTPNGGRAGIGVGAVAFAQNQRDEVRTMDVAGALAGEPGMKQQTYVAFDPQGGGAQTTLGMSEHHTGALGTTKTPAIAGMQVRRLTPRECERLQGFPDDYTLITVRGKPAADGPRYKALGNSMAVPVMRWIGERIALVDAIAADRKDVAA